MSPNASAQVGKFRKQNVTLYQRRLISLLNLIEVKLQDIPTVKLNNGAAQWMSIFELLCVRCIH